MKTRSLVDTCSTKESDLEMIARDVPDWLPAWFLSGVPDEVKDSLNGGSAGLSWDTT